MGLTSPRWPAISRDARRRERRLPQAQRRAIPIRWRVGRRASTPPRPTGWRRQITLETTSGTCEAELRTSKTQASLGSTAPWPRNGCSSCHAMHNAQGANSLLRAADDQTCLVCHNGSSNISPAIPNVLAEMVAPKYGHAFSVGNSPHLPNEAVLLNQNRHVTCVDCHNAHSPTGSAAFPPRPPSVLRRPWWRGSAPRTGRPCVSPASNQYENCLRCHGTSTGKKHQAHFRLFALLGGCRQRPAECDSAIHHLCDLEPSGVPRSHQSLSRNPACART